MEAFTDYLAGILAAALIAVGTYLARKIGRYVDWIDADTAAEQVERYTQMAIESARGWVDTDAELWDSARLNSMTEWVLAHVPEAMEAAGLTDEDVESLVRGYLRSLTSDGDGNGGGGGEA